MNTGKYTAGGNETSTGMWGGVSFCGIRSAKVSTEHIRYTTTASDGKQSAQDMEIYVGVEVSLQPLLISVLDGGELSGSLPGRLTTGRNPTVPTL